MHNLHPPSPLLLLLALSMIISNTTAGVTSPAPSSATTTILRCPNCGPKPVPYPLSLIFSHTTAITSPPSNATNTTTKITTLHCPNCGPTPVPYPFSTSPTCGDPLYNLRCTQGGILYLDVLNKSSYPITSISPPSQRLLLKHTPFKSPSSCINDDFVSGGIWLDPTLPFTISENNLVLKINCSDLALKSPMNCSDNSLCHAYLRDNVDAHKRCADASPTCCAYTSGGSQTNYRINLSDIKCRAYRSFVNLTVETSLPVSKWPDPAIEIHWVPPREPFCEDVKDCKKLVPYSTCLASGRENKGETRKRCLCIAGYRWDFVHGTCSKIICQTKRCRKQRLMKRVKKAITYTVSAILFLALSIFVAYKHKQRIRLRARQILINERQKILNANNVSGKSSKLFTDKEIKKATNNFARPNLLGSGGFGDVYQGTLDDKTPIAVKRAKLGNSKGIDQVLNEVRVLCQVNHKSLVRLLGCCVELDDPVLVYEFIQNGTLYDHLHGNLVPENVLTWKRRLLIAHQTAQGLSYLHFSAVPPIIHRDIKSGNILLDENFHAKISDFGISRLADTDETHISTCVQGTLGYLDPEYHRNFQLSDKSDVYSFGVVLLEMITSQKAVDASRPVEDVSLVAYVRRMARCERLVDVIDPLMKKGGSGLEVETMVMLANLALACLDEKRQKRPTIKEVAEEIEYILSLITHDESKHAADDIIYKNM